MLKKHSLQHFRKAAIFRRMRRYAKDCERHRKRVVQLEDVKKENDEWLVLVETCWTRVGRSHTFLPNFTYDMFHEAIENINECHWSR